ncbi:hypothetical protein [Helicobacter suis]|uniref:hypothetical protein n=1 Tax=Helicobacter suis TaxID=104628 RepID=UPI0013D6904C|nr:hypothetical protein [Helicobacter suis]
MDNFLNGFLKAWRSWRSDGREAFMRAFLQEVQQAKPRDSEHFFTLLKQEMQAVSTARSVADQQDILAVSDYIDTLKEEMQHTLDNTLEQAQIKPELSERSKSATRQIEQQEAQQLTPLFQGLQEQQQIIHKIAQEIAQLKIPQLQESLEEQELLQSISIFKDEIQEIVTEQPNRLEQELDTAKAKNPTEQNQESQSELFNNSEQGLEITNKTSETPEPKQTPPQATDIENKYAKLHSYFKQVELDVQQKRIKTKSDFKESFLNYAKSHMTEAELKVLLVLSQKQPSKLTQEHRNLINDALEQAHGNKHMQDRGLQLSVKAVLGYPLEAEHYTTIQSYVQQCQASLEPMDGKVAGAMHQYLAKMQRSRETSQQEAVQIRETTPEQSLDSTPLSIDRYPNQVQTNNQAQTTPTLNSTAQQEVEQKPSVHLGSATTNSYTTSDELDQQAQTNTQAQPVANNTPTRIPEPWIESQNSSKPWLETQTQDAQVSNAQTAQQEVPKPWLDAPAKPRGRRR